ncbi:hypothetical protein, variant 1 [Aphanomyces invadans]|uniref:CSC1/OSCA1-like 7TM region domain-containing protein n=1 Tax=Aphanomyces invadans TaxID=157072 RepID=A0A024TCB3_9STRA|nr:hypothetical protein, variant 1 [Aphanomyces invadans]ETV91795.1 hypothetical protein, variant 1 [Aphanomyces invadans]|eukprot:XP_008879433.1 hypothetical protein, variant 1 [Aphanomyces invadans]
MRRRMLLTPWLGLVVAVLLLVQRVRGGGIVLVPSGSVNLVSGRNVTGFLSCDPPPTNDVVIDMALTSRGGESERNFPVITPNRVRIRAGTTSASFTVEGRGEGRFYVQYQVTLNLDYHVKHAESVIMVLSANDGWEGIQFQIGLNLAVFGAGLVFFVWRRLFPRLRLPIWHSHPAGLFERINFDQLPPGKFQSKYGMALRHGSSLSDRARRFVSLPCDGKDVIEIAGLDAALSMRLHADLGHLFLFLTVFSVGVLIPIHYMSGKDSDDPYLDVSFQETTIGNVPLQSHWYWGHVAMTYLTVLCVLRLLKRQDDVGQRVNVDSTRAVGHRSVLISSGLPKDMNSFQLRQSLAKICCPADIKATVVIHDLQSLYRILDQRVKLRNEYNRLLTTYARANSGTLPGCVRWCPGGVCCPSVPEVISSYVSCLPCRSLCCSVPSQVQYSPEHSGARDIASILENALLRDRLRAASIQKELESFPSHVLDLYAKRQSTGAAFVVFSTVKAKLDFDERVRLAQKRQLPEIVFPWDVMSHRDLTKLEEQPVDTSILKSLVLRAAPEPDDVNWPNLTYKPQSVKRLCMFVFYQLMTVVIIIVFSTPTAVLIYMKLDNQSAVYAMFTQDVTSIVAKFATSYLPSLLLIAVNWCLLTSLFYVTTFEPWLSESERMKSFLKKGFSYLLLSSIVLPSIGVTAVYLASEQGSSFHHGSEAAYIEKFMFQLGRNFFIAYVCQRAFLGSILQLLRVGERFVYQPWLRARAVTKAERRDADRPWPYYFGYDYAVVLSTFMVTLLGVVLSPLLTPFGAVYFYMKYFTMKYNLLYVHPKSAGRGHVARSAYTIIFVCLVLFEFTVAVVILEVGRKEQFAAMVTLICTTIALYLGWWRLRHRGVLSSWHRRTLDGTPHNVGRGPHNLKHVPERMQMRVAFNRLIAYTTARRELDEQRAYINPYDAGLKVFNCIYTQQKATTDLRDKRYAFDKLKAVAAATTRRQAFVAKRTKALAV